MDGTPRRTHLKRAGMHPVTERFAGLYARQRKRPELPPEKRKHVSCTPEVFQQACRTLGIENAKQLGEVIGKPTQSEGAKAKLGERRWKSPADLTELELFEIAQRYAKETGPLLEEIELARSYGADAPEFERQFEAIAKACSPLFSGSEEELEERTAIANEYTHRFLIEATKALSPARRETLFTVLTALLAQERDGGNQAAGALLESWALSEGGGHASDEQLADLVKGRGAVWLRTEPFIGVEDITTGRIAEAIDVTDALLLEYAGLIGAEYGED